MLVQHKGFHILD